MSITCEKCERNISVVDATHSALIVLQKVTEREYTFYQCDAGTEVNHLTLQHFHCSEHCMLQALPDCLNNHYTEEKLAPIPLGSGTTLLHKIVLAAGINCKTCQQPLTTKAYRFALTLATPYNTLLNDGHENPLGEWCCSIEHARTSTQAILASIH